MVSRTGFRRSVFSLRQPTSPTMANRVNVLAFMRQRAGAVDPTFEFYETDPGTGARRAIADRDRVQEMLREISPITHVTSDDPPTILVHGDRDQGVPVQQSRQLLERLMQANVPARLEDRATPGQDGVGQCLVG